MRMRVCECGARRRRERAEDRYQLELVGLGQRADDVVFEHVAEEEVILAELGLSQFFLQEFEVLVRGPQEDNGLHVKHLAAALGAPHAVLVRGIAKQAHKTLT
eukprot:3941710-Rhodomonas_salina.2